MRLDRIKKNTESACSGRPSLKATGPLLKGGKQTETPLKTLQGPSDEAAGKPLNDQS